MKLGNGLLLAGVTLLLLSLVLFLIYGKAIERGEDISNLAINFLVGGLCLSLAGIVSSIVAKRAAPKKRKT